MKMANVQNYCKAYCLACDPTLDRTTLDRATLDRNDIKLKRHLIKTTFDQNNN